MARAAGRGAATAGVASLELQGARFAAVSLVLALLAVATGLPGDAGRIGVKAKEILISLSIAHLLMLGAATVISVYKPWGKTWFGRRKTARLQAGDTDKLSRATPELAS
jgi:hypothetical protein